MNDGVKVWMDLYSNKVMTMPDQQLFLAFWWCLNLGLDYRLKGGGGVVTKPIRGLEMLCWNFVWRLERELFHRFFFPFFFKVWFGYLFVNAVKCIQDYVTNSDNHLHVAVLCEKVEKEVLSLSTPMIHNCTINSTLPNEQLSSFSYLIHLSFI